MIPTYQTTRQLREDCNLKIHRREKFKSQYPLIPSSARVCTCVRACLPPRMTVRAVQRESCYNRFTTPSDA
jgi:hypothetical protein